MNEDGDGHSDVNWRETSGELLRNSPSDGRTIRTENSGPP